MPNLNAVVLAPHQRIAGTVSALMGSLMTILGIGIANMVASRFDGTLYAFTTGYLIIASISLFAFYWVDRLSKEKN